MEIFLSELDRGKEGVLLAPMGDKVFVGRLWQFGLIEGTKIRCIGIAPMGSPMLFSVRGMSLALRKEDCKEIPVIVV